MDMQYDAQSIEVGSFSEGFPACTPQRCLEEAQGRNSCVSWLYVLFNLFLVILWVTEKLRIPNPFTKAGVKKATHFLGA
jgi:hypothetical protein